MIYTMTFSSIPSTIVRPTAWTPPNVVKALKGRSCIPREIVANRIKQSEDDSFIFILTKTYNQYDDFNKWIDRYGLREYIIFEPPLPIENGVHPENGRNLCLVILASKEHMIRDLTNESEEENAN